MTELTTTELKIIYAQLYMAAAIVVFWGLFLMQPISAMKISPETTATSSSSVSVSEGIWIANIIQIPPEFTVLTELTALFISPLLVFDAYIVIRAIKDLATQWV